MKKIPSKVKILGREFKIKQGRNLVYGGQPVMGLCDYEKSTIYLEKNLSVATKRATFVHECCHAFMHINGMDQKLSESEMEIYCQLIAAFYEDIRGAIG